MQTLDFIQMKGRTKEVEELLNRQYVRAEYDWDRDAYVSTEATWINGAPPKPKGTVSNARAQGYRARTNVYRKGGRVCPLWLWRQDPIDGIKHTVC